MRLKLGFALAALALAACGQPAATTAPSGAAAGAPGPGAPAAAAPGWVRDQWSTLPDWNFVANIADGGKASFAPRSIKRDRAAGTADVDVQVLHLEPVPYRSESKTTIETVWYFKERATYRLNCPARTYIVAHRDYIGAGDAIIGSDQFDPKKAEDWRPIDASGLALVLEGPVCKAA